MPPKRDEETGRYEEEYSDEMFLSAVSITSPSTTSSIANEVGCSYDLAYRRLHTLEEEGELTKEEIGGTFVWSSAKRSGQ